MGMDHRLYYSCVSKLVQYWALPKTPTVLTSRNSIIGGALMSFLPKTNKSGLLAGIYLVNAVVAPLTIFYNVSSDLPVLDLIVTTSLTVRPVDCRQLCRCHEAGFCSCYYFGLLLARQHYRAPNFPGARCP